MIEQTGMLRFCYWESRARLVASPEYTIVFPLLKGKLSSELWNLHFTCPGDNLRERFTLIKTLFFSFFRLVRSISEKGCSFLRKKFQHCCSVGVAHVDCKILKGNISFGKIPFRSFLDNTQKIFIEVVKNAFYVSGLFVEKLCLWKMDIFHHSGAWCGVMRHFLKKTLTRLTKLHKNSLKTFLPFSKKFLMFFPDIERKFQVFLHKLLWWGFKAAFSVSTGLWSEDMFLTHLHWQSDIQRIRSAHLSATSRREFQVQVFRSWGSSWGKELFL